MAQEADDTAENLTPLDSRKQRKDSKTKNKEPEKPQTKVIIRKLPPSMTLEMFLEQVSPIPEHDYLGFVPADLSMGPLTFCRAYIHFISLDDVLIFRDKFDGYVFVDNRGTEFPAVVEFAPYQKVKLVNVEQHLDEKSGTIEDDADYLQFIAQLENQDPVQIPSSDLFLEEIEAKEKERKALIGGLVVKTTPLIEFVKQRRVDREKAREEKREERKRREVERRKQRDSERPRKTKTAQPMKLLRKPERPVEDNEPDEHFSPKDKEEKPITAGKHKDRSKDGIKDERQNYERKQRDKETNSKGKTVSSQSNSIASELVTEQTVLEKSVTAEIKLSITKEEVSTEVTASKKILSPSRAGASGVKDEAKQGDDDQEGEKQFSSRNKEGRLRNKDRPTLAIYTPGSRKSKTQPATSEDAGEGLKEIRSRTFMRSSRK
uniref:EOG090X04G9 n=1 Tax=Lynceus sp. MCZ IZ 141354 TaxID=1930659 RepID=A0A9N6ZFT2_9CRUS|nr:EOG090X04G9 [Lynceus sp. MCZ IZ 141354]